MLWEIRESLRVLYSKYDNWLRAVGKFLLALLCFVTISSGMGQMDQLNDILLLLILALMASFLPLNAIVLMSTLMILAHLYAVSIPALIVGGGVLLIVLLLYFGLAPGQALALILMPLAIEWQVPLLLPIAFGLLSTPLSGFGMAAGTVGYYSVRTILQVPVTGGGTDSIAGASSAEVLLFELQTLLKALTQEGEMILTLIAVLAVLILVFAIRKMEIKYAWRMAVGTGTVIFLTVELLGAWILDISMDPVGLAVGTVISVLAGILLQLFFFDLDYRSTEKLQFEDDEYYYYVTAVPKRKRERTVDEWTQ